MSKELPPLNQNNKERPSPRVFARRKKMWLEKHPGQVELVLDDEGVKQKTKLKKVVKRIEIADMEKRKEKARMNFLSIAHEQPLEMIPKEIQRRFETERRELDEQQKFVLKLTNEISNTLVEKFGGVPYDYAEKNIYLILENLFQAIRGETGSAFVLCEVDAVAVNADKFKEEKEDWFKLFITLLEEFLHAKSDKSIEVDDSSKEGYRIRKMGLGIHKLSKEGNEVIKSRLVGLEEAVVNELIKRELPSMLRRPEFKTELEWRNSKKCLEEKNKWVEQGMGKDEILWIARNGRKVLFHGYPEARKVLNFLTSAIAEDNGLREDVIFEKFAKARHTSNLLPLLKIIEGSVGKTARIAVTRMGKEPKEANLVFEILQNERKRILKERLEKEESKPRQSYF